MQSLFKHISLMLLMVCSLTWANQLEETEPQKAMPKEYQIRTLETKQPITEKTLVHLYNAQIAIPILAEGELPGYHPHHSRPKCLHTVFKQNRGMLSSTGAAQLLHQQFPHYYHIIDYYIYTLEHILI